MKQLVRRSLEAIGGLALAGFGATQAFAGIGGTASTVTVSGFGNVNQILSTVFRVVTVVGVILFVVLLLIGGIQYLGSFGNEETTKSARKLLLDAVVGLFIVLAAGGIANFVLTQFGVSTNAVDNTSIGAQ